MKLQKPKGTRDFYPSDMAWRRYLEDAWRRVSIRNGFEEVDGPIFESLDLYKVKSGDGIVSELFHFTDRGDRDLAIRPEFTPTLARMVAEKANTLPRPSKWFCMPNLCRAESPQRGRLREFLQWNVDVIGLDDPVADVETIHTAIDLLRELGLSSEQVKVKVSHREVVRNILSRLGVADDQMLNAFQLLDARDKMDGETFVKQAESLGLDAATVERFNQVARVRQPASLPWDQVKETFSVPTEDLEDLRTLHELLRAFGIAEWCEYDLGIVRGLAYYTGTVYEVHEVSGNERAMAGGGRYDELIGMFGSTDLPAVGFGMGDVVLSLVLKDKGVVPENVMPSPDAFVIVANNDSRHFAMPIVSKLRASGLHTRFSYRSTTNVGKLLKEANQQRTKLAIIIDANANDKGTVSVKNMLTGDQDNDVRMDDIVSLAQGAIAAG